MASLNEELLDAEVRHAIGLQRLGSGVVKKIIALLNDVDADLVRQIIEFDLTPGRSEAARRRLQRLLGAVREIIQEGYNQVEPTLRKDLLELAGYEAEYQQKLLTSTVPVAIDVIKPSAEQLAAIVTQRPFEGALMRDWASRLSEDSYRRVSGAINMGFAEGETVDQMVRRVRGTRAKQFKDGVLEINRRNAEAIVRTAVAHTATAARDELFRANDDLIKGAKWVSTLDTRTTPVCRARDGQVYPLDSGPRPPAHWNCLPGDVRVLSVTPLTGATKRWFDGDVVIFQTASGRELTCTPNHPILTDHGWVAAEALDLRSKVVCDGRSQWEAFLDSDDQNVPSRIHDVAKTILGPGEVFAVPVPVAAEDFHGDGSGSKVAVVRSDRHLGNGFDTTVTKHLLQRDLRVGGAPAAFDLKGTGNLDLGLNGNDPASCGDVGSLSKGLSTFRANPEHASGLLVATSPHLDAVQSQYSRDGTWSATNLLGYSSSADTFSKHGYDDVIRQISAVIRPHLDSIFCQDAGNYFLRNAEAVGNDIGGLASGIARNDVADGKIYASSSERDASRLENAEYVARGHAILSSNIIYSLARIVPGNDVGCDMSALHAKLLQSVADGHAATLQNGSNRVIGASEHSPDLFDAMTGSVERNDFIIGQVMTPRLEGASGVDAVVEGGDVDANLACQILNGATGPVFTDHIVKIERRSFSGHVYNLETIGGFYSANGIVTHNCRSTVAPIVKSWEELGIDEAELPPSTRASMNGQVPEDMTYGQWLRKQSRSTVEDVMGKTKAKLFLDGNLPVDRFVNRAGDELTLSELRTREAEAFKRAGLS